MNAHNFSAHRAGFPAAMQAMLSAIENGVGEPEKASYPPYNIIRADEDTYLIEMAIAGFSPEEIDISIEKNSLKIVATKAPVDEDEARTFLHRGLAKRNFSRNFTLGEYMVVEGAEIRDGILTVNLLRKVPDEAKPRKVEIRTN